jgi:hypothetical protein
VFFERPFSAVKYVRKPFKVCINQLAITKGFISKTTLTRKSPLTPLCQRVPKAFGIWQREVRRDFIDNVPILMVSLVTFVHLQLRVTFVL